ncbi:MAG: hypothetical protein JW924_03455 [Fusobacteriaceae bacterium]|nr:hypothetical protein [Fusobacteriaceae bacterium]
MFPPRADNFDSLAEYKEDGEFFKIELFQLPFISYEYLIAEDPNKSDEENFELKKGAGSVFSFCGRGIGKSLFLLIDLLLDAIHNVVDWVTVFASFDEKHLLPVWNPLAKILKNHSFFRYFEYGEVRSTMYEISSKLFTHTTVGIGMGLSTKKPGSGFEYVHSKKMAVDEAQYETEEVYNKRTHSVHPKFGAIERLSGITSFRSNSPLGRLFQDTTKQGKLINLPKYVYGWNEVIKADAIKKHNGEDTLDFKIHIRAEICKDVEGVYDMERIRMSKSRKIKHFEVDKKDFWRFRDKIVVDKPKQTFRTWIASDFGERKAEIIVLFEIEQPNVTKFLYSYNITLYNLIPDEHFEIFEYLIEKLSPNFIGIDATDVGGKEVVRRLEKAHPEAIQNKNFIWVQFNKKVPVKLKLNDKNEIEKDKNGKPIYEEEFASIHSVTVIKKLLYNDRILIPIDYKFTKQFQGMISAGIGNNVKYACDAGEDHLHQSFQVFGIMYLLNELNLNTPVKTKKWGLGC